MSQHASPTGPLPPTDTAQRLQGVSDIDPLFRGGDRVVLPWRRAPQRRGEPLVSAKAVQALLMGSPFLTDLDPVQLCATQTWVVRSHAPYYLSGTWEQTGTTSADRHLASNRYPLVLVDAAGNRLLLASHYRALAALVQGRPLRARVHRPAGHGEVAVLPTLLVGDGCDLPHTRTDEPTAAASLVASRTTAMVPDLATAKARLEAAGLHDDLVEDRLAKARIGRCLGPR